MNNLEFIQKLYNGKNCYSDHMDQNDLKKLHITSNVESIIRNALEQNRIVFLTGNPGDGKTFLIRSLNLGPEVFVITDLNDEPDYNLVARNLKTLYDERKPCIVAANEFPFRELLEEIEVIDENFYEMIVKQINHSLVYDSTSPQSEPKQVFVIDLNNRNMLDKDRNIPKDILYKMLDLLKQEQNLSSDLKYNIKCLNTPSVSQQVLNLFTLCADSDEHFATRDILGSFSYILTSCNMDNESSKNLYYDAIFQGSNSLLTLLKDYDPVYLTTPIEDEKIWNGELTEGWLFEQPDEWPNNEKYDDDVDGAIELFKSIKRKYYFENIDGQKLYTRHIRENKEYLSIFNQINDTYERNQYKKKLISSLNKLFLPVMDQQNKCLYIWTTHHYDLSRESSVCVSTRNVDAKGLELVMPKQPYWLNAMEYVPDHLILQPKDNRENNPKLKLDMDFLRTLNRVNKGYPVELLSPKYEQSVSFFLQQLSRIEGVCEENEDGEIILASRIGRFKKSVYIRKGKQYSF